MTVVPRRPRRPLRAAGLVGLLALGGGLLGIVPMLLALQGVLGLAGGWDPTWNDGDGWIVAAGVVVLALVMAGVAGGTLALGERLPARRLIAGAATVLCLLVAAGGVALVAS